jgi:hypothetical protein
VVVLIVFGILVPITRQTQIIELLKVVTWPAVVVFIILVFHETIKERVRKTTDFNFEMPGGLKFALTVSELEAILKTMLQEVDSMVEHITPEQSREFIKFSDAPTQVSEKFERHSRYHDEILRPLRALYLIRPSGGSQWGKKGEYIEITPFGRLVLQIRGEQIKQKVTQAKAVPIETRTQN